MARQMGQIFLSHCRSLTPLDAEFAATNARSEIALGTLAMLLQQEHLTIDLILQMFSLVWTGYCVRRIALMGVHVRFAPWTSHE